MAKLTVAAFLACKGQRQLTQTFTTKLEEAKAYNEAGLDVLVTMAGNIPSMRQAAPDVFLVGAADFTECAASDEAAIRCGLKVLGDGADAVYVGAHDMARIKAMADAAIPVIGHVGLVPYRNTWVGGMRAVGKTAEEAMQVYERTMAYQAAGAISVEMEVVPHQVASAISARTSMIVISMGSGQGCDGQYLFAEDILGTNAGHVPRHAKRYRNLAPAYADLHKEMVAAFKEFKADVDDGGYPNAKQTVNGKAAEVEKFLGMLPS